MENNHKTLDLTKPLLFLITFVIFLGMLVGIFSYIDKSRKEKVYNMYSQETQVYMRKNQDELEKIFTNKNKDSILKLLSSDLKDFSSTAFLKKTTNGRPLLIRLSGEVQEIYIYPHQKETMILKLLNGQQDKIPWDEYIYELQGKEVIIPFKDKNGKVLGAIVRAVIE